MPGVAIVRWMADLKCWMVSGERHVPVAVPSCCPAPPSLPHYHHATLTPVHCPTNCADSTTRLCFHALASTVPFIQLNITSENIPGQVRCYLTKPQAWGDIMQNDQWFLLRWINSPPPSPRPPVPHSLWPSPHYTCPLLSCTTTKLVVTPSSVPLPPQFPRYFTSFIDHFSGFSPLLFIKFQWSFPPPPHNLMHCTLSNQSTSNTEKI